MARGHGKSHGKKPRSQSPVKQYSYKAQSQALSKCLSMKRKTEHLIKKLLSNNLHGVKLRGFIQFHIATELAVVTKIDVQGLLLTLGGQASRIVVMD